MKNKSKGDNTMKGFIGFISAFIGVFTVCTAALALFMPYVCDEKGIFWAVRSPEDRPFYKTSLFKLGIEKLSSMKK